MVKAEGFRLGRGIDVLARDLGSRLASQTRDRPRPFVELTPVRQVLRLSALLELVVLNGFVALLLSFELGAVSIRSPYLYARDALFFGMNAKTLLETGWVQNDSRLGAPFGQRLYDFPQGGDNGNFLILKMLSLVTHDWVLVLNLFFLLSFFLAATSAWFVLRLCGISRGTSVGLALLFDFAYFHFARYEHLFLTMYATIPLGIYLALRVANGSAFEFAIRRRSAWLVNAGTVATCAIIGSFNAYWALFTTITIAVMAIVAAVSAGHLKPLLDGALASIAVVAVLTLNEVQSLAFAAAHGANPSAGLRFGIEQDYYGLRLIQMLSPAPAARIARGPVADITSELSHGYQSEPTQFLGTVAAFALLALLAATVTRAARPALREAVRGQQLLGTTVIAWILIGSTGGLEWLIWVVGFHHLRSWGRASIIIMFLTLVWLGLVAGKARAKLQPAGTVGRFAILVVGAAVLLFGVFDEMPGPVPADTTAGARLSADRTYFAAVEAKLPQGTSVFNLPIRRFPEEGPTHASRDYDLLVPFLNTASLRFSYGGVKGRESEWQQRLIGVTGESLVRAVGATGFGAIMVDRFGYDDQGASLEASITAATGVSPLVSADGRWSTFDLGPWLAAHPGSTSERAALLGTPILAPGSCGEPAPVPGSLRLFQCPKSGLLSVVTPEPTTDQAVQFQLVSTAGDGWVSIRIGQNWHRYRVGTSPTTVSLPTGGAPFVTFEFTSDTPVPTNDLVFDEHFEIRTP